MVESKENYQRHTENTVELCLKCFRLENDLEFANRNLAQRYSTLQSFASQADLANSNVLELARCFDTRAQDPLDFPMISDLLKETSLRAFILVYR